MRGSQGKSRNFKVEEVKNINSNQKMFNNLFQKSRFLKVGASRTTSQGCQFISSTCRGLPRFRFIDLYMDPRLHFHYFHLSQPISPFATAAAKHIIFSKD
jgi:hypothetical protein